jgi:DNA-binding CsgD family transcriptional regulator
VNYCDIAQNFVEYCQQAAAVHDIKREFERVTQGLGFRYFACCSHVDPLDPPPRAVMFLTYPAEWVRRFSEEQYQAIDPVFYYADQTLLPFSWDSDEFLASISAEQRKILNDARAFGIEHGRTMPIHLRWAIPASCTVIPDSPSVHSDAYFTVFVMSAFLYEFLRRDQLRTADARVVRQRLSVRERQCVELAALGKSDWAAGAILGISERTVHNHIESVKRRLGVTTRVQAIVQALFEGEISFGDLFKPRSQRSHPNGEGSGVSKRP